jgi:hypothetical protein
LPTDSFGAKYDVPNTNTTYNIIHPLLYSVENLNQTNLPTTQNTSLSQVDAAILSSTCTAEGKVTAAGKGAGRLYRVVD